MKKNAFNYVVVLIGILLFGAGAVLRKLVPDQQGVLLILPYVFMGFGCGAFGYGLGDLVSHRVVKSNPELQKQIEIEKNDERSVAVSNRAKAKTYDLMLYIFGALMLSFALMGVDITALLLLAAAYLVIVVIFIYYLGKYNKEM